MNNSSKKDIKNKKRLLQKLKMKSLKNKELLNDFENKYDSNLDEDLMPIDENLQKELAKSIQGINSAQNKIMTQIRELKEEISSLNNTQKKELEEMLDEDDEPTIELPIKDINEKLESQIKIVFDGSIGMYKIYSPFSETPEIHVFSTELLCDDNEQDYNLIEAFKDFDMKYNTNLHENYINNIFSGEIIYDLRKFNNIDKDFINSKQKKQIKKIIKNYMKKNKNCKVITRFNKKAVVMLGVGIGIVGAGVSGLKNSKEIKVNNELKNTTISSTIEENLENGEKNNAIVIEKPAPSVPDNMPIEEPPENLTNDGTYYNKNDNTEAKDNTNETKEDIEPINNEILQNVNADEEPVFKVGSIINASDMENIDLYEGSTTPEPVGNTEGWNFGGYKVGAIAFTDCDTIINVIRDSKYSMKDLINEYENAKKFGFKISLLIEGLDDNGNVINPKVGWVNYDDLEMENINVKTK